MGRAVDAAGGVAMHVGEHLLRSAPRVLPLQPLLATSALGAFAVLVTANPGTAIGRLRPAAALVAASAAFVLDDDAAITLASVPVARSLRRGIRVLVALWIGIAWVGVVVAAAVARSGAPVPSSLALLETAAIAAIAIGAACVAIDRSDDGRGGAFGAAVALACFGTSFLPARWWWPMTARPETGRLLATIALAAAVAVLASLDPARRRPRLLREYATSKFGGKPNDHGARSRA